MVQGWELVEADSWSVFIYELFWSTAHKFEEVGMSTNTTKFPAAITSDGTVTNVIFVGEPLDTGGTVVLTLDGLSLLTKSVASVTSTESWWSSTDLYEVTEPATVVILEIECIVLLVFLYKYDS